MLTQRSLWMVPVLNAQGLSEVLEQNSTFTKEIFFFQCLIVVHRHSHLNNKDGLLRSPHHVEAQSPATRRQPVVTCLGALLRFPLSLRDLVLACSAMRIPHSFRACSLVNAAQYRCNSRSPNAACRQAGGRKAPGTSHQRKKHERSNEPVVMLW